MKIRVKGALFALIITALLPTLSTVKTYAYEASDGYTSASIAPDVNVSSRLLEVLFGKKSCDNNQVNENIELCPGGDIFGAKIKEGKITVMQSSAPAIHAGDILKAINGKQLSSIEEVRLVTSMCQGELLTLTLSRGTSEYTAEITPIKENDSYKLGIALRDSTAGIGTITYIEPESGAFAGLGHGICDAESGRLTELSSGTVTGVILGGVKKGESGKPGELRGVLTSDIKGALISNTECGVFGVLNGRTDASKAIPVAKKSDVHEGDAKIISTVKNGKKCEFAVKIFDVDQDSYGTKSFKIKVTDPSLISLTGGIVRGMSGSPVVQNGKLIGAVTHVMVADPTEGYGIFIENMLASVPKALPDAA